LSCHRRLRLLSPHRHPSSTYPPSSLPPPLPRPATHPSRALAKRRERATARCQASP
jgi:hypothetical protein